MRTNQQSLFKVASHSNMGKNFEKDLESVHDWYRLQGWADIRKIPNSWTFISLQEYQKLLAKLPPSHLAKTADNRFLQRVKSDVDFVGAGKTFGVCFGICFDAKEIRGNRFPLSNVESHQLYKLKERNKCGIISGIMINYVDYDQVFFVPYKNLNNRIEKWLISKSGKRAANGTASLAIEEVGQYSIEIFRNRQNTLWDWMPVLIK